MGFIHGWLITDTVFLSKQLVIFLHWKRKKNLFKKLNVIDNPIDIDRVIEMAWEDRTPFKAIEIQFGLTEAMVI